VTLSVSDDGTGITAADRPGVGTTSMRERAEELGGHLTIASDAGGARVTAYLPLAKERAGSASTILAKLNATSRAEAIDRARAAGLGHSRR
jgi:signal transduction histidine kinase